MAMNHSLTDAERENIIKLYRREISATDIASIMQISPSSVSRIVSLYRAAIGELDWDTESAKSSMRPHIDFIRRFTHKELPVKEESCTGLEALIHAIETQTSVIVKELAYIEDMLNEIRRENGNGI